MVEKIGHVKNPLTVIAIFAALAEVSGTVVLPMLQKEIQELYVWFLMSFPPFLVALFFGVLYKKHHVMYAPTDFKDDKTFKELFEKSGASEKVDKINSETEEIGGDNSGACAADGLGEKQKDEEISASETLRRTFQGISLLAEELVVAKISKSTGLKFDRNLEVKGLLPKLVFDAVATTDKKAVVVEARFTRQGNIVEPMRRDYFDRVARFSDSLPEERRGSVEFIFALVTDSEDEEKIARMERVAQRIQKMADEYAFKTTVHFFKMKELEREFKVK